MDENKKVWVTVIVILLVIVLGGAVYYFVILDRSKEAPEIPELVEERPVESAPREKKEDERDVVVPYDVPLDESDPLVRSSMKTVTSNPALTSWLAASDLIRRFVAAVDNVANGQSPRAHFDFFKLKRPFEVKSESGRDYIDPASFARYDAVAEAFVSLDTEKAVMLYRKLKPVIQDAYRELGYPERDFQGTLEKAIRELLRVPVVKDILLQKKVVSYAMVEPRLENMSQAQKHLLRMGAENVKKIQAKLREMAEALGIPPTTLPSK